MIPWLVVADDLSGAAELGAAARRSGLRVSLTRGAVPAADCEVWVVDTNTRDLPRAAARSRFGEMMAMIRGVGCRSVFKKIDSVLRGHAGMESEMLAAAFGRASLKVVAGNPARGRTVADGVLRVDGVPLAETLFREDPLYPAEDSAVSVLWAKSGAEGDVPAELAQEVSRQSLHELAARIAPDQLPVGALEFFMALLEREPASGPLPAVDLMDEPAVWMVCGSPAGWPDRERLFRERSWPVQTGRDLSAGRRLLIGCGDGDAISLARGVRQLAEEMSPTLWCLEGGATASAVMEEMGWTAFDLIGEVAPGTACLRPADADCRVLVKPGSYEWPPAVIAALERCGKEEP